MILPSCGAGISHSFVLMMLSVYVHHQKDDYQQVFLFYQVSVCVQSSPSVWQLSLSCDIQLPADYYTFQHLMYRTTAVLSCVIKFNSKMKLSNYIYRTTPLFLSTHQKNSTKNGLWVFCKCTPSTGPVGTLYGLMPCFTVHRNYIVLLQWLKWTMAVTNLPHNFCQQGDNNE